jgi:SAM-dependent methyltransferase
MSWKLPLAADDVAPDYLARNRSHWDDDVPRWVEMGRRAWAAEPSWGIWAVPESEIGILPAVAGMDTLEVGCGTGYFSAWLARRGAAPVGLDNSMGQLRTAAGFQEEFALSFPLVHGAGEQLPFAAACFDLVISEYGAAIWSDPYRWIPEAARVLRPGGELIFLANSVLFMLCAPELDGVPAEPVLLRPQFGMRRFEWPDDDSVEFHLGHGDLIRLLHAEGFAVADLIEIQAPAGPSEVRFNVPREWARAWPSEEVWRAVKQP